MSVQFKTIGSEDRKDSGVKLQVDGEHAEVILDTPGEKVNKLTRETWTELQEVIGFIRAKSDVIRSVIFRSGKLDSFLAGADITTIEVMKTVDEALGLIEKAQEVFQELAELPQMTVAVIDGACMGGGTELALACKYRIISDSPSTRLGLPEVQLGVLPGAGGTQRLPRLIGIPAALEMMTSGAPVNPSKALKIGLVHDIIPKEYLLDFARQFVRGKDKLRKTKKASLMGRAMQTLIPLKPVRAIVIGQAKKMILSKSKGFYPAPIAIVDVVDQTTGLSVRDGLKVEARAFAQLAVSPIAKNLIQLFFASEQLKKERGVGPVEAAGFQAEKLKNIGVVGAGIMGGGIAAVAASKGISVRMKDIQHESILNGLKTAGALFEKEFKRKKITKAEYLKRVYAITPTIEFTGFKRIPFVVEAVIEKMEIKKALIDQLETLVSPKAIIASNTSSLSISEMASQAKYPERIVGMHFFNPVPKMPLVEVIRAEKTSPEVVVQTVALAKQMGKTVIVVKDRPGFLVNRVLMPFLIECAHLYAEGFSIAQIDEAATRFGMPMGPFRLLDEIGLDTAAKVAKVIAGAFPHLVVLPLVDELVQSGNFGRKTGKGFYQYDSQGKPIAVRGEFSREPKNPSAETDKHLTDRLILPMVTEAVMALDEGIVGTVRDLDLGLIFGIGFPPFRGGLLRWVSTEGEQAILDRMYRLNQATRGRLIVPQSYLSRVQNGQKFYS